MNRFVIGLMSALGRVMIVSVFLFSTLGNKIPNFEQVAGMMTQAGMPFPKFMLIGAIVFLIVGSLLVAMGLKVRIGASMLLLFLVLANYFFHDFWTMEGQERDMQIGFFLTNVSLMGTMLFLIANGSGAMSWKAGAKTG